MGVLIGSDGVLRRPLEAVLPKLPDTPRQKLAMPCAIRPAERPPDLCRGRYRSRSGGRRSFRFASKEGVDTRLNPMTRSVKRRDSLAHFFVPPTFHVLFHNLFHRRPRFVAVKRTLSLPDPMGREGEWCDRPVNIGTRGLLDGCVTKRQTLSTTLEAPVEKRAFPWENYPNARHCAARIVRNDATTPLAVQTKNHSSNEHAVSARKKYATIRASGRKR